MSAPRTDRFGGNVATVWHRRWVAMNEREWRRPRCRKLKARARRRRQLARDGRRAARLP